MIHLYQPFLIEQQFSLLASLISNPSPYLYYHIICNLTWFIVWSSVGFVAGGISRLLYIMAYSIAALKIAGGLSIFSLKDFV